MLECLTSAPLVVEDQEEALQYYTQKLGWEKRKDYGNPGARFLTVAPKGSDLEFMLVKGTSKVDLHVGPDAGTAGLQFTFLSEDVLADYKALKAKGVDFHVGDYKEPQKQFWGWNAAFKDPWGNQFVLVQPNVIGRAFGKIQSRKSLKAKARS